MQLLEWRSRACAWRWVGSVVSSAVLVAACSKAGAPSPPSGASSTGGAGGTGGGAGVGAGEACSICRASECRSELDACAATTECAPWLSCLNACDSRECTDNCNQEHPEIARVHHAIYACSCDRCGAECTPAQSCEQQCVDAAPLPLRLLVSQPDCRSHDGRRSSTAVDIAARLRGTSTWPLEIEGEAWVAARKDGFSEWPS